MACTKLGISGPKRSQKSNEEESEDSKDEVNAAFLLLNALAPRRDSATTIKFKALGDDGSKG